MQCAGDLEHSDVHSKVQDLFLGWMPIDTLTTHQDADILSVQHVILDSPCHLS